MASRVASPAKYPPSEEESGHRATRKLSLHASEGRVLLMLGDLICLSLALLAVLSLRFPSIHQGFAFWRHLFLSRFPWWLVLTMIWISIAMVTDAYGFRRASAPAKGAIYTGGRALLVSGVYLLIPVVSSPLAFSRHAWFLFGPFAILGVFVWRVTYAMVFHPPSFSRRVLVVGAGQTGQAFARAIDQRPGSAELELVGYVDDDPSLQGTKIGERSVLATSARLVDIAQRLRVDGIVVAISDPSRICLALRDALARCSEHGIDVAPISPYYEQTTGALSVDHIGQNLLSLTNHQSQLMLRLWDGVRSILDMAFAAICLLLLAPFLPLIALAIRLDSPGPVFYRQGRVGRGGRLFSMWKFRSMIPNAEVNGPMWCRENDDRVTRMGRFMRKTHIDELPQLGNVLRGQMSLIGPRPERPEFVRQLDEVLPNYSVRHSIKPGLTGLAQVRHGYGNSVNDARTKLEYDLYYVKNHGPVLDAVIALRTIRTVIDMQGT